MPQFPWRPFDNDDPPPDGDYGEGGDDDGRYDISTLTPEQLDFLRKCVVTDENFDSPPWTEEQKRGKKL